MSPDYLLDDGRLEANDCGCEGALKRLGMELYTYLLWRRMVGVGTAITRNCVGIFPEQMASPCHMVPLKTLAHVDVCSCSFIRSRRQILFSVNT